MDQERCGEEIPQKAEAAAAVAELLKVRPGFTVETLAQDGAQYSDNPTVASVISHSRIQPLDAFDQDHAAPRRAQPDRPRQLVKMASGIRAETT